MHPYSFYLYRNGIERRRREQRQEYVWVCMAGRGYVYGCAWLGVAHDNVWPINELDCFAAWFYASLSWSHITFERGCIIICIIACATLDGIFARAREENLMVDSYFLHTTHYVMQTFPGAGPSCTYPDDVYPIFLSF